MPRQKAFQPNPLLRKQTPWTTPQATVTQASLFRIKALEENEAMPEDKP